MWSHPDLIWEGTEIEPMDELVTYAPASGTVVSYEASIGGPSQSVFQAVAGSDGIRVSPTGENLRGLYPIKSVTWLDENQVEQSGTEWSDVPQGARMTEFVPNDTFEFIFPVTCTCNWLTDAVPPVPQVAVTTIPVTIWQQFDINQQILRDKVAEGG